MEDVPLTRQESKRRARPRIVQPEIPIPIPSEIEDLEELTDEKLSKQQESEIDKSITAQISNATAEIPARPILEVYPEVISLPCKGVVKLLLLVSDRGRVEEVKIIENTTGNIKCAEIAKQAARKSKWIPAKVDKKSVNSWVTKIYKLNVK